MAMLQRKKPAGRALIISVVLTAAGLLVNLIGYFALGWMPLGLSSSGGEYREKAGFGLLQEEFFPMTASPEEPGYSTTLSFSPLSLLFSFVLIFLLMLIVCILSERKKGKAL